MKLLFIILTVMANIAWAQMLPDYAKESRWASHVEDGLMDGDIVWLDSNNHKFMVIYTPSETDTKITAIVIHGLGVHPNWPQVIQPLRVALTEKGFNTLSIQMPVLANGIGGDSYSPLFPNADRRIKAAIDYIERQGLLANTLIAHSLGTKMSAYYLANNNHPFKRFIGIGMGKGVSEYLSKINIQILDLYGNDDIPGVLSAATQKQQALKFNPDYTQMMVDADHFFNDKEELLIDTVSKWLN